MKSIKYFVLALFLALASYGCASDRVNPFTGAPAGAGTYAYSVTPDGAVTVNADSLRGGPTVRIEDADGGSVTITPSNNTAIEALIDRVLAP